MKASIDHVRELAGKNAALLHGARGAHEQLFKAADVECDRLSTLIDGVSHADVITDPNEAEAYQAWVLQRAKLLSVLAERDAYLQQ